jgi:hypothetical protein
MARFAQNFPISFRGPTGGLITAISFRGFCPFDVLVFVFFDTLLSASVFVGFVRTWSELLQRTTSSVYAIFTLIYLLLQINKTFYHLFKKKKREV